MSNAHNHCPECKSHEPAPALKLVFKDRIVKECLVCGHMWNVSKGDDWANPEQGGAAPTISETGYITINKGSCI